MRASVKDWTVRGMAFCRSRLREEWATLLSTTVGTALVCFAIVALVVPYKFAGAGVTGIALITSYLWGISPAWFITVGNALLLLWGWRFLSTRFALWTLYVTVLTSLMVPFFEWFRYPVIENTLLAAILSGVVSGVGFGMLFRVDACSGGTDVVVMVAKKRWGVDVGAMSFYINIVRSFHRRTQILVISTRHREIAGFIMTELERSATLIPATGAYRGASVEMLLVVLPRRQVPPLKRFIASVDPTAFVILSEVSEVVGEGFKSWLHV